MKLALTFRENALLELTDVEPKDRTVILEQLGRLIRDPGDPRLNIARVQSVKDLLRLKVRQWRVFFRREQATVDVYTIRRRRGDNETYRQLTFDVSATPLRASPDFDWRLLDGPAQDTLAGEPGPDERQADEQLLNPPAPQREEPLPVLLTETQLIVWEIPDQYHPSLVNCRTAEDLLGVPVPAAIVEQLLNRLYPKSIQEIENQPRFDVPSIEILESYLDGRVSDLLLHLDDEQAAVAAWQLARPALIRGGPGTGKTVVALYRTVRLLESQPGVRVLYTTYTTTLARYAEQLLSRLTEERGLTGTIEVRTVDSVITRFAPRATLDLGDRVARECLREVLRERACSDLARLGVRYLLDEFHEIIDGWNVQSLEEYLGISRQGRRLPLVQQDREQVWQAYLLWRRSLQRRGVVTWPQRRSAALSCVTSEYDAIVVDEAQDLTPTALRCLLRLCRNPHQLTLVADTNQSLYQRGLSWKSFDDALDMRGKSAVLRRTYRSTQQIYDVLRDLARSPHLNVETLTETPQRTGPAVERLVYDGSMDFGLLKATVLSRCRQHRLPLSGVAILATSTAAAEDIVTELNARSLNAVHAKNDDLDLDYPAVKVMTLHSAKGLEFPLVFVCDVNRGQLPRRHSGIPAEELETYEANDLKLLFVGCSRAMTHLVLTYDRANPSPFLTLLEPGHWTEHPAGPKPS